MNSLQLLATICCIDGWAGGGWSAHVSDELPQCIILAVIRSYNNGGFASSAGEFTVPRLLSFINISRPLNHSHSECRKSTAAAKAQLIM